MSRLKLWSHVGLCSLLLAGCAAGDTRLPTLGWGDARVARRQAEYNDPLPESEGPSTSSRPRGFEQNRNEVRRTLENGNRRSSYSESYPAVVN